MRKETSTSQAATESLMDITIKMYHIVNGNNIHKYQYSVGSPDRLHALLLSCVMVLHTCQLLPNEQVTSLLSAMLADDPSVYIVGAQCGFRGVLHPWFDFWFWCYIYCLVVYIIYFPTYAFFFTFSLLISSLIYLSFENRPSPFPGWML